MCLSKSSHALVFDLQRCSMHDGPGIRTTVFLKGCPLRCKWCHNPEALSFGPQWMAGATPADRGKTVGQEMGIPEILRQLERDRPYFKASGGGLTISGGEPMSRFAFTLALLKAAKAAGFHTCLDTSGEAPWEQYAATLPFVDVYHYDYKATGSGRHASLVGTDGTRILDNLRRLLENGSDIILRCPMVPGVNDQEEHFQAIARLSGAHPGLRVEILPYHDMSRDKRRRLAMEEIHLETHIPTPAEIRRWKSLLQTAGVRSSQLLGSLAEL